MAADDVVLWDAESLFAGAEEYGSEYITDIFRRGEAPPPHAVAIAIGLPLREDSDDLGDEDGPWIIGSAIVASKGGVAQGKVRVRFEPYRHLKPIRLTEVLAPAGVSDAQSLRPMSAVILGRAAGGKLLKALANLDSGFGTWVGLAQRRRQRRRDPNATSRVEARDAVGLAGIIAGVPVPGSMLKSVPTDDENLLQSVLVNAHRADTEEDLLPEELRRFDGLAERTMYSASTAVFRSHDTQLTVFNVNKKAFEVVLGVDLIYWDILHDAFTLIQYKRMERGPSIAGNSDVWIYSRENDLRDQLELMPALNLKPTNSSDWRIAGSPFWFKFVRSDAATAQDDRLLGGMYVAAEYLRLALEDGSLKSGPRGGFRVTHGNTRHLDRDSFVHLVKSGLIGTMAAQSADLHLVIQDLTAAGRSVIVAVKSRWQRTV